jgi:general secretion pathway protein B
LSLILDALNRSRQDQDPVPGLATQHVTPAETRSHRQILPWAALAVAVLFIAWLLIDRSGSESASLPVTSADPVVPATASGETTAVAELSRNVSDALSSVKTELKAKAAEEPRAVTGTEASNTSNTAVNPGSADQGVEPAYSAVPQEKAKVSSEESESVTASSEESSVQAQQAPAAGTPAAGSPAAGSPAAKNISNASKDVVADLYRQKPAAVPVTAKDEAPTIEEKAVKDASTEEEPIDIARMLELARSEMGAPDMVEHSAPMLAGLSQQVKDSIPTILYQQHDYSERGAKSSVTLNGKQLGQGASAAGVQVREILPNSVVLEYRGTVFRLRALNSWVNL